MALSDQRILSRPCRVRWAGWETTTTHLQQYGWQLAAEHDYGHRGVRIAFRHREYDLRGVSEWVDYRRLEAPYREHEIVFVVRFVVSQYHVQTIDNFSLMKPIDAMPQIVPYDRTLDDFNIFATPLVRTEELIVEPKTVAGLLEEIKRMQAPGQREIRQRRRDDEPMQRQVFHAQIISLADHREAA